MHWQYISAKERDPEAGSKSKFAGEPLFFQRVIINNVSCPSSRLHRGSLPIPSLMAWPDPEGFRPMTPTRTGRNGRLESGSRCLLEVPLRFPCHGIPRQTPVHYASDSISNTVSIAVSNAQLISQADGDKDCQRAAATGTSPSCQIALSPRGACSVLDLSCMCP